MKRSRTTVGGKESINIAWARLMKRMGTGSPTCCLPPSCSLPCHSHQTAIGPTNNNTKPGSLLSHLFTACVVLSLAAPGSVVLSSHTSSSMLLPPHPPSPPPPSPRVPVTEPHARVSPSYTSVTAGQPSVRCLSKSRTKPFIVWYITV
ncbi:uncharacterized [Tachysurus ichikawai]